MTQPNVHRFEAIILIWSRYADWMGGPCKSPWWSKHCEKLVNNFLTPSVWKDPVGSSLEKELNYLASRG